MPTLEQTLAERGTRYGDFADHARIAQDLQDAMRNVAGWHRMRSMHRQALTTIADKIARILNGDPDYADNWHDIQGYAKLVEDRLLMPRPSKTASGDCMDDEIIDVACYVFPDGAMYWCDEPTLERLVDIRTAWESTPGARDLPKGCHGGVLHLRMPRSKYVALGTSNNHLARAQ